MPFLREKVFQYSMHMVMNIGPLPWNFGDDLHIISGGKLLKKKVCKHYSVALRIVFRLSIAKKTGMKTCWRFIPTFLWSRMSKKQISEHTWLFAVMLLITAVLSRLAICWLAITRYDKCFIFWKYVTYFHYIVYKSAQKLQSSIRNFKLQQNAITWSIDIWLHCALSLAAQCIVMGPVCLCVGLWVCLLWVCYHDNSKLRPSIFAKLGL